MDESVLLQDSIYIEHQLTEMLPGILESRKRPRSAERLFPMFTISDRYLDTWRRQAVTKEYGKAHRGTLDAAPDDVPMVDLDMGSEVTSIGSAKLGWYMTFKERHIARKLGLKISDRKARLAVEGLYDWENDLIWNGDPLQGLKGILTPSFLATSAIGGSTWNAGATTPKKIYEDLIKMAFHVSDATGQNYEDAVTIALPPAAYRIIATTPRSDNSDKTILQYFRENDLGSVASVVSVPELKDSKRALVYIRDEEFIQFGRVPIWSVSEEEKLRQRVTSHYELRNTGILINSTFAQHLFSGILT